MRAAKPLQRRGRHPAPLSLCYPLGVKILSRALRGSPYLCFVDLEATQFSHECIEIGAKLVSIDPDGSIRREFPAFRQYVKAKRPIGKFVSEMTGITEERLRKEGLPFPDAIEAFKKYVGSYRLDDTLYLTWGPGDITILNSSMEHSHGADERFLRICQKRHLDFQSFLKTYVQDNNGNPLSLHNALLAFGIEAEGREHDASTDANSLYHLYRTMIENPQILEREYMKTLSHFRKMPAPLSRLLDAIFDGKTVDMEMFTSYVRDTFK